MIFKRKRFYFYFINLINTTELSNSVLRICLPILANKVKACFYNVIIDFIIMFMLKNIEKRFFFFFGKFKRTQNNVAHILIQYFFYFKFIDLLYVALLTKYK